MMTKISAVLEALPVMVRLKCSALGSGRSSLDQMKTDVSLRITSRDYGLNPARRPKALPRPLVADGISG